MRFCCCICDSFARVVCCDCVARVSRVVDSVVCIGLFDLSCVCVVFACAALMGVFDAACVIGCIDYDGCSVSFGVLGCLGLSGVRWRV